MTPYSPITGDIRKQIVEGLGAERIVSDPGRLKDYEEDASGLRYAPELVVEAESVAHIQTLLALANRYRFPVIPRGGGTGLAGGCLAASGGVILSLAGMNQIRSIDPANLLAEVEPGVITATFREKVREKRLFYPPDPAGMDKSTLGGNAATNAGGPACVKYGTTRDYVLGLEVVLPDGNLIRTGVKTRKGVVGYDLTHLIVGSEGTLGVITALYLKLIPSPQDVACLAAVFKDLRTGLSAVSEIMGRGHLPSAVEFMDPKCLALVGDLLPFRIPGENATLLIIETDGIREQIAKEIEAIGNVCLEIGATHLLPAPDRESRARIWDVRRQVSLRIHESTPIYMAEDIVVPISRIASLVDALPAFEKAYDLRIYAFGHAGDGNIHLNFTAAAREDAERMLKGVVEVFKLVIEMEGTISGEHGIGEAKKQFLPMELPRESIRIQKAIKEAFDPNLILNPGKIFI
jgi:D-lactate dehydrogenase (cytochrome)